jgi:hypothetical protein
MNGIDTIHEYAGLQLAGLLHGLFAVTGLPLIVALGGSARLVHRMADTGGTPKELAVHLLALLLLWGLLSTTAVDTLRAPRLAVWTTQAADLLQKRAARSVNADFLEDPYGWERLAAMTAHGRIFDAGLSEELGEFLASCATTALATAEPRHANLLRPGALPYRDRCETWRGGLWDRVQAHVREDPRHRTVLLIAERRPGDGAAFGERYADLLVTRAIDEPGSPTSESALVLASLGRYAHFDPAQSTGGLGGVDPAPGDAVAWATGRSVAGWLGWGVDGGVSMLAALRQAWSNRFAAKQAYYLVIAYGPHVYGLALMLVLGFFPVAGLWALLPGRWEALVNWGKTLAAVKLWPVGWAALSAFNQRRGALEALDPAERGAADAFLGVAAMYVLVPAFAFAAVHAAASAAALPFSGALPAAAGAPRARGLK